MKKKLIFILYDLGISLSALSFLYRYVEEDIIKKLLTGDYLEIQFESQIFSDQDLKLLDSREAINNSKKKVISVLEEFKREDIEYFVYYDVEYPKFLKNIKSPPFFLFLKGNKDLLEDRYICSMVGTRKPSCKTLSELENYITEMVSHDIVTASGLALGTDIHVHLSTINNGGQTIAVLPGPVTSIIPKSHTKYAHAILNSKGLLISEHYLNEPDKKINYISRNRIISGISNAVIIAECKASSGTMHTARFAYIQKKPLYCLNNKSSGVLKILNSNSAEIYNGVESLS